MRKKPLATATPPLSSLPTPRVPPVRWQTQPLAAKQAARVREQAHAALDEQLEPRLAQLQSTSHVTAEKLERLVHDCVRGVGQAVLGTLLESEAWIAAEQETERAACPTCGQMSPRARDPQGQPQDETMTLQTLLGPVPWHAPQFACPSCRRFFSPSPRAL
jgi:hypothetical protein